MKNSPKPSEQWSDIPLVAIMSTPFVVTSPCRQQQSTHLSQPRRHKKTTPSQLRLPAARMLPYFLTPQQVTSPTLVVGNSCRKKNLEPCTCFEFRVRAASAWGWSGHCDPVMVVTLPSASEGGGGGGGDNSNTSGSSVNRRRQKASLYRSESVGHDDTPEYYITVCQNTDMLIVSHRVVQRLRGEGLCSHISMPNSTFVYCSRKKYNF